jgi:hypothetical protein
MNRKAIFITADMFWFVLFVFVAIMGFFVLQHISGGIKNKLDNTHLDRMDASFIATTLPRMHAANGIEFSIAVQNLNQRRLVATELSTSGPYLVYKEFLDSNFIPLTSNSPSGYFPTPKAEKDHIIAYAVVMGNGTGTWLDTCLQYPESSNLCKRMDDMDLHLFFIGNMPSLTLLPDPHIRFGSAYIPTVQGPVTLTVVVEYA